MHAFVCVCVRAFMFFCVFEKEKEEERGCVYACVCVFLCGKEMCVFVLLCGKEILFTCVCLCMCLYLRACIQMNESYLFQ